MKTSGTARFFLSFLATGACLALTACASLQGPSAKVVNGPPVVSLPEEVKPAPACPRRADFNKEPRSQEACRVANWVMDSADNHELPFAVVDKVEAKAFVFGPDGKLRGAAPVLLGLAQGDDSAPDIGERSMSEIRPEERTTPAGRFIAALGRNFHGKDVLWVDYDKAVSMHRVVTSNPSERRLQRLSTPTPADNRISFGCINVPENFFNEVIIPTFKGTYVIVYVLPEKRSCGEIFATYYPVD